MRLSSAQVQRHPLGRAGGPEEAFEEPHALSHEGRKLQGKLTLSSVLWKEGGFAFGSKWKSGGMSWAREAKSRRVSGWNGQERAAKRETGTDMC